MIAYVLRRVVVGVAMVVGIAAIAFLLVQLMPNDVTSTILGETATEGERAALRHDLGLDRPILTQFGEYMGGLLSGDLGESISSRQPVAQQVADRLPVTLTVALLGVVVCLVLGVAGGVLAALRGGWVDALIRGLTSTLLAVPNFWLGVLVVYVFAVRLGLLPSSGWTQFSRSPSEWALHLVLPVIAISVGSSASVARQTRIAMLDNLSKDYVTTLRALGLPEWRVTLVHALRNASIPVLTVVGLQFVAIFGGTIVVEQVFGLPGVGQLAVTAAITGDFPVLVGVVVCTSAVIVVVNILIDILYALINPKARLA